MRKDTLLKCKKKFTILAILAFSFAMVASGATTLSSETGLTFSKTGLNVVPSHSLSLEANHYTYFGPTGFDCASEETITWSFSSTGSRILVLVCTDTQFSSVPTSNYYAILSSVSYGASGTFTVPYPDTWYIIYFNNDPTNTAELTFDATYHPTESPIIPIIITSIVVGLIVVGFISIGIRATMKKKQMITGGSSQISTPQPQVQPYYQPQPQPQHFVQPPPTQQTVINKETIIIKEIVKVKCSFCGALVESTKSYCHNCSASM
jgi:hypothetical protein